MKLIFVYNSTLKPRNLARDFLSQVVPGRPSDCKLCDVTYNFFFMKKEWKAYIKSINIESEFLLRDQFETRFGKDQAHGYPCGFLLDEGTGELRELVSKTEINGISDLQDLIKLVKLRLETES